MPFTEAERQAWHRAKAERERERPQPRKPAIAECVNCQNGFGINEGVITDEVAMCDVCLGHA